MTNLNHYLWMLPVVSFVITILAVRLLIPLAHRTGWVDRPDIRKVHEVATPVVGGVSMFLGFSLVWILAAVSLLPDETFWLLGCALLILLVGLVDDIKKLGAGIRMLMQAGVCLLMAVMGGVVLTGFGPLFSMNNLELGMVSVPVTIFAAMGVINAFNMIDGMDGLGGSIFLVAAAGMAIFAFGANSTSLAWLLLAAIAAVAGFMVFNARFPWNEKARAFMGNSGSTMLGFLLAWFFVSMGSGEQAVFMPMTAVWLFAVPLLDTSTLIWTRWRQGQSAFEADNQHLHHAFLRAGFSQETTCLAITLLALVLAGIGSAIEFSGMPGYFSFYFFMVVAFTYYFYLRHCWSAQQFLGRHFVHHDFTIEESLPRIKPWVT